MLEMKTSFGILGKLKSFLGSVWNLFPLGGTNGGIIVRQKGGTNEVQVSVNGNIVTISVVPGAGSGQQLVLACRDNNFTFTDGTGVGFACSANSDVTGRIRLSNTSFIGMGSGVPSSGSDVTLYRLAAGVYGIGSTGATGIGWIQNSSGESCLASSFTKANATLGATNLSLTVIAGRSYRIDGVLQVSNTTATEGVQITFDGGACSAITFFMSASMVGTNVAVSQVSTTLAGTIAYSTVTGTDYIILRGFLKTNVGGTFILRAAENTTAAGTMTMGAGSWIALSDTVPL